MFCDSIASSTALISWYSNSEISFGSLLSIILDEYGDIERTEGANANAVVPYLNWEETQSKVQVRHLAVFMVGSV
jgi:hypothetical protein